MRTQPELLDIMRNYMVPEEIVEAIGITSEELVEALGDWCEHNYDKVEGGLVGAGFAQDQEDLEDE